MKRKYGVQIRIVQQNSGAFLDVMLIFGVVTVLVKNL